MRFSGVGLALALFLISCSIPSAEDRLLEEAFYAIRDRDWDRFQNLTITRADFMMRRDGIGPFKAGQSFAGGSLRPEELKQLRLRFEQLANGGTGMIDFRSARFRGAGPLVEQGSEELLGGGEIPFHVYSFELSVDGSTHDTRELGPLLVIVDWGDFPRILDLVDRSSVPDRPVAQPR